MPNTAYGKACRHCAKAKAKCTLRGPDLSCERCHRLNKDCQPATGARRKPGPKQRSGNIAVRSGTPGSSTSTSRTDLLEKRLDDLVQLLGTVPSIGTQLNGIPLRNQSDGMHGSSLSLTAEHQSTPSIPPLAPSSLPADIDQDGDSILGPGVEIRWQDAEIALTTFREKRLLAFPFVHVPATTTARDLRQSYPMLWLSIMACCASSSTLQQHLGGRFRQLLADQVIAHHKRSLDHLLGLLCYMGWAKFYMGTDPFMFMYSHILVSLVQDLALDQPHMSRFTARREPGAPAASTGAAATATDAHPLDCLRTQGFRMKVPAELCPEQSMEVKRALLASYLMSGLVSQLHHRPSAMSWVGNLEECLYFLDATPETPLDRVLAHQVRLQRIVGDIPPPTIHNAVPASEKERILQEFQTQALLSRLRQVEQMQPTNVPENVSLACHRATTHAEAAIYAMALCPIGPANPTRYQREGEAHENRWQIDMLTKCLYLTKDWFRQMFALSTAEFFYSLSFQNIVHHSFFCIAMYRLVKEKSLGWDCRMARQHLDVGGTLDTLQSRFEECPLAVKFARSPDGSDIFSRAPKAIRIIKGTWLASWQDQESSGVRGDQGDPGEANVGEDDGRFGYGMADGVGVWFADMFAPGWDADM